MKWIGIGGGVFLLLAVGASPWTGEKIVVEEGGNVLVEAVDRLYEGLREVTAERRTERLGGNPGRTYNPGYGMEEEPSPPAPLPEGEGSKERDPLDRFAALIAGFQQEAKEELGLPADAPVNGEVRHLALEKMVRSGPTFDLVFPTPPSGLYLKANENDIFTIGSKYLLGHWEPEAEEGKALVADGGTQTQNVSHILHFNAGLAWRSWKPKVDRLFGGIETRLAKGTGFSEAVFASIRESGFLEEVLTDFQAKFLRRYGDHKAFAVLGLDPRYREFLDMVRTARELGLRGTAQGPPDLFLIFLAYEIVSKEGYGAFGIDALNDLIATQAGVEFGEWYRGTTAEKTEERMLRRELDASFRRARRRCLQSLRREGRDPVAAFFQVHRTVSRETETFIPVAVTPTLTSKPIPVWRHTLATSMQRNREPLTRLRAKAGTVEPLVQEVLRHVSDVGNREREFRETLAGETFSLSDAEVRILFEVVEVLMLIDEAEPVAARSLRIGLLGASVSAGLGSGITLADAIEEASRDPVQVLDRSNPMFVLNPMQHLQRSIEQLRRDSPDVVIALDALFWFGYGEGAFEKRRAGLERALTLLDTLSCPIVVGDLPEIPAGSSPFLKTVPSAAQRERLNRRIREWAQEKNSAVLFPLSEWFDAFRRGTPVLLNGSPVDLTDDPALQQNSLHPTERGLRLLARSALEQIPF